MLVAVEMVTRQLARLADTAEKRLEFDRTVAESFGGSAAKNKTRE